MDSSNTSLVGRKEIVDFTGRSWAVIVKWIDHDNFPAKKQEGRWESDKTLIMDWRRQRIKGCLNG